MVTTQPDELGASDEPGHEVRQFLEHFDHTTPFYGENYPAVVTELSRCPILHSDAHDGFWIVPSYKDVRTIALDTATYSSARNGIAIPSTPPMLIPAELDPPLHMEFRRLMNPFLSPGAVSELEPDVATIATELLEDFPWDEPADLCAGYAFPLVAISFFRLVLGVRPDQAEAAHALAERSRLCKSGEERYGVLKQLFGWCEEILEERRTSPPRDDLIGGLLGGEVEGRELTRTEQTNALVNLTLGGVDTTTSVMVAGLAALCEAPDIQERLWRDPDDLLDTAVEEMLRHGAPATIARTCTRDVVVQDRHLPEGEKLFLHLGAANRDASTFDEPERFDVTRSPNHHMAFGVGPHHCVGAHFARLLLRVGMRVLIRETESMRLEDGKRPEFRPGQTRAPLRLPCVLRRRHSDG